MNFKILNARDIRGILALIESQWDAKIKLDFVFLTDKNDKLYIINKEFVDLNLDKMRIQSIGLYFGTILNGELRLSIEGSQIVGPKAKKNVIDMTDEQVKAWLKGEDIKAENKENVFVILKHNSDFIGTGKFRDDRVLNFVPKERRLKVAF